MGVDDEATANRTHSDLQGKRRRWEFGLIAAAIRDVVPHERVGQLKILEFGCGAGHGIDYLSQLGSLLVTDIYRHPLLSLPPGVEFRLSDICQTDFRDEEFDLLVSNQVLEYLDVGKAFQEMKRIGNKNAYYAFSVPTATWLMLSIPGQVYKKLENVSERIATRFRRLCKPTLNDAGQREEESVRASGSWLSKFAIRGHGYEPGFFRCLKSWRAGAWEKMLLFHGFEVIKKMPLLAYGSSRLPIIPTNRSLARLGVSASYLFICRERSVPVPARDEVQG